MGADYSLYLLRTSLYINGLLKLAIRPSSFSSSWTYHSISLTFRPGFTSSKTTCHPVFTF